MEKDADIVLVSYDELVSFSENENHDLLTKIEKAFGGEKSLGLLAVVDVPGVEKKRARLLPLARRLALLDDKSEVVSTECHVMGWSHGKEIFDGKPDTAKGSFYASFRPDGAESEEENLWPHKTLPDLKDAFMDMGKLMAHVGLLLARVCDYYIATKCPNYEKNKMERYLTSCTGRLLHYFPREATTESGWCGWHHDHCCLTGLVPGLLLDESGNEVVVASGSLCVRTRSVQRVSFPPCSLGFQMGETSQVLSGGWLRATLHAVSSSSSHNVTRESFALFLQPDATFPLEPPGGSSSSSNGPLPPRWKPGMTFGDFAQSAFDAYYEKQTNKLTN